MDSEYDLRHAGSKKIQIQRQTQRQIQRRIQRQIQEQLTDLWCYMFLERRWQKDSEYDMRQAGSNKIQIQRQKQIKIQIHPTA